MKNQPIALETTLTKYFCYLSICAYWFPVTALLIYATISYGEMVLHGGVVILYFPAGLWDILFLIPLTEVCTSYNFSSHNLSVPVNIYTCFT
jgi:hypothetical protein